MSTRTAGRSAVLAGLATMLTAAALSVAAAQNPAPAQPRQFGADYDGLTEIQRTLVDDIYRRVGAIVGRTLDPKEAYDRTPLSVRTTFDAVTNALLSSTLTDQNTGEALGRPIDLIDYLETVAGQVKGAPGDQQFRLYVVLEPGALDRLARSKEFRRTADNSVFHKGYPTSYRQDGYPSVQFSIAKDGTRADIDVDYRSSRFPAALVNGHLTAANSDVRAGNYERHTQRWSGLVNWWEGFVAVLFSARTYDQPAEKSTFPVVPRAGNRTIDVAVDDFLTTWLVDGQPNVALAYADREAYQCLALRLEQEGQALDRGLAPFQMYMRMKAVNDALGPRERLEGLTIGIRLTDPNLKLVDHHKRGQYSIYGVPRALADQMTCASYTTLGALPEAQVNRFVQEAIDTFYVTFFIAGPGGEEVPLGLLWQKRNGYWKIVSYQGAEDTGAGTAMPDLRPKAAAETEAQPHAAADPDLVAANQRFLEAWLVGKRYDEAFDYFSARCYPCVNLYLNPGEAPAGTADAQRARLRDALGRLGDAAGRIERLEDVIQHVTPIDPRLRIVDHPSERAFSLFAVPDWAGPQADCQARLARGDAPYVEGDDQDYGQYYTTALQFVTHAGETAVLYLGWVRDDGAWRIFSFTLVEP